jgi:hypothetical protein
MIVELRLLMDEVQIWRSGGCLLQKSKFKKIKIQQSILRPRGGLTSTAQGQRGTSAALGNSCIHHPRPVWVLLISDTWWTRDNPRLAVQWRTFQGAAIRGTVILGLRPIGLTLGYCS